MAEVTVRVGVLLGDPAAWLTDAAAFDAAGADALWLDAGPDWDVMALAAAVAAVTHRARLVVPAVAAPARTLDTVGRISGGRLTVLAGDMVTGGGERWRSVPVPESRASWRDVLAGAEYGVVVPAHPRLLDLLRNPDDPGERLDLHLAQG